MLFRFNDNAKLHIFDDGSGIAVYNRYSGDSVCLRSSKPAKAALTTLLQSQPFSRQALALAFMISDIEAERVLGYLQDNNLLHELCGN